MSLTVIARKGRVMAGYERCETESEREKGNLLIATWGA